MFSLRIHIRFLSVFFMSALSLMACSGGGSSSDDGAASAGSGNSAIPIPSGDSKPAVRQETLSDIVAAQDFKGAYGEGYAHVCPADNSMVSGRNFLIKVHGYSPKTINKYPGDGELEGSCNSLPDDRNYHVLELRYRNGGDYIQRNAGFVRSLLEKVIAQYQITSEDNIALVGYSMGGVVARYALLTMESEAVNHHVDLYISVDSPHLGAYVPIAVQHLANAFSAYGGSAAITGANAPAAKQMLRYHYSQGASSQTWTDDYQQLYIVELQAVYGGYPAAEGLRKVAVASGRSDGHLASIKPGDIFYSAIKTVSGSETIAKQTEQKYSCTATFKATTINIDVDIIARGYALSLAAAPVVVASTDVAGYIVKPDKARISIDSNTKLSDYFATRVELSGCAGLGGALKDKVVSNVVAAVVKAAKAEAKPFVDAYNDKTYRTYGDGINSASVPGGLGYDIKTFTELMTKSAGFKASVSSEQPHAFVTLGSALGIEGLYPTDPAYWSAVDFASRSPFDQLYYEDSKNMNHIKSSHDWFTQEVLSLFNP
ncbi:lipase family alpha/beta hydrolase [Dasania marina]|uniref:lipase family alpha/beta hydrolase n=1 Tax=Dasania marina TaxID=471499 RepID=UPI0003791382|nr:DUF2974 domain-containing protein [Dasania marina]